MIEAPTKPRWFQTNLRNMLVATFWVAVACAVGTAMLRGQAVEPIWGYVAMFSVLAAFWSLLGRYWNVLGTWAYFAVFFLVLFWLHKQAILGE